MEFQILINLLEGIRLILWTMAIIAVKFYPLEIILAIIGFLIVWFRPWRRR